MQKPPPWELDQHIRITATAPPGITPIRATSSHHENGLFAYGPVVESVLNVLKTTIKTSEQEYQVRSSQLPQTIEQELAATRLEGSTHPLPPSEAIIRELGVRNTLLARKTAEFHHQTALANRFYGVDPIGRRWPAFYPKAVTLENPVRPNGIAMQAWLASYKAAYEARLLSQTIQMLNQQQVNVLNWLAAVQAQEQVQREAQYLAAEAARKAKEAKEREEAAAKRRAEADARLKELYASIASMDAARANRPFPVSGTAVAAGPVFTLAMGRLATRAATTQAVRASLQTAVAAVIAAGTASASAVMVGFAARLFPSPLGNSDQREMSIPPLSDLVPDDLHNWSLTLSEYEPDDLHALSVPLSDLVSDGLPDLHAIAEANRDIELPVAMGSRTVANTTEFFVAATNGTTVPSKVPVLLATLDPTLNVYRSYNPDAPSIGMTWTPIVQPNNASTSLPASEMNVAVYDGTTVTALEGRIDRFPELDLYSFGGFITVFPVDSGMPPVYTMFRDRRNEPGVASGLGQKISGSWLDAASQRQGAPIPAQIADQLRGREFKTFRAFRESFWKAVANDQLLITQFTLFNKFDIRNGLSPSAPPSEQVGRRTKFEIHHVIPISEGGSVYDIDNLRLLTPKQHIGTHSKNGET